MATMIAAGPTPVPDPGRRIWLINNAASGSNDAATLAALEQSFQDAGFQIAHRTVFPAQELPDPALLDAAQIDLVAIFAGDGTINRLVTSLYGWNGAVLILPGGTMNLLYHRLHGQRTPDETIRAVASGAVSRRRPSVIRCPSGDALAGLMAGPGTSWNQVREAMRDVALVAMANSAALAIGETFSGAPILCQQPQLGRREGYPLIMLTPEDGGMLVEGFYSDTAGAFLEQTWALLRRNFREGPREDLGRLNHIQLAVTDGQAFGLLLDGEPAEAAGAMEFVLVSCEVDLLATQGNDT
ncbi:diacylglycerol kinase [Altererythrobacter xixiisoli]|uniref:Diacylglycerol kinase n=1 Tax=Croceibacterium xixiisoli TaxID=1476466 RepID=A0A6I4TQ52_9SPHN|nr:diacylglycerol kinase family protein [Croceibacterium xixiisoli]MXO97459.1 diacylglycerol kinase [Croceibacterium xixiisoli]